MASKLVDLSFLKKKEKLVSSDFNIQCSMLEIEIKFELYQEASNRLKKISLKIPNFKYVESRDETRHLYVKIPSEKTIPSLLKSLLNENIEYIKYKESKIILSINNFTLNEILSNILPNNSIIPTGYESVGHLVHLNLKDDLLPFKCLIGDAILLKNPHFRTVINKIGKIDTIHRNIAFELIAGVADYDVIIYEQSCSYSFDYSKVYWNSRLETAHKYVIDRLNPSFLLVDLTAGVGPFCIPASKKKRCFAIVNDINPECIKFLTQNVHRNKVQKLISVLNLDAKDCIEKIFTDETFLTLAHNVIIPKTFQGIQFILNLPELSLIFLPHIIHQWNLNCYQNFIIYCFFFYKSQSNISWSEVDNFISQYVSIDSIIDRVDVRKVSPNKTMILYVFHLQNSVKKISTIASI